MKTVTRFFVLIAAIALVVPAAWAQVTLPFYDGFNYPAGSTLGGQGGWVNNNTGDSIQVITGSLSFAGFPASAGNKISFDGAGVDPTIEFVRDTVGTIYYSYLIRVTAVGGMTAEGYCSGYYQSPTSTTSGALVWIKPDGSGFDFGLSTRLASVKAYTGSTRSLNTTYLVVSAYKFIDGTTNDSSYLWVNPDATTFGKTAPAPTLGTVNNTTDLTGLARLFIRQDLANTTPFIELDEVRIGRTWAQVTSGTGATSVDKESDMIPQAFRLEQNYPNPFNPSTTIRFSVASAGSVSLRVFDMLGREMATLVNETMAPGTYSVKWNASSAPSGIYFTTLRAGNSVETKRMALVK